MPRGRLWGRSRCARPCGTRCGCSVSPGSLSLGLSSSKGSRTTRSVPGQGPGVSGHDLGGHTHSGAPGAATAASPHPRCAPPPQAFRALCTREKLLAAFGSSPVRLSTANTYSYRKGEQRGSGTRRVEPVRGHRPDVCPCPQWTCPSRSTWSSCWSRRIRAGWAVVGSIVPLRTTGTQRLVGLNLPLCPPPDTLYFFGDNNLTEWGPLFQQYVPPPFRIPGTSLAYSFGIAGGVGIAGQDGGCGQPQGGRFSPTSNLPTPAIGSGSGVPFHWHGPGFSEVIFGRKVSFGGCI